MPTHRSIEQIIEEQARRWQLVPKRDRSQPRRPVIAVSRQRGSGGGEVARRVAEELKLDLFDHEIIHRVAEDAHLSERVVSSLDEKDREVLMDWLSSFAGSGYLSPVGYLFHLTRVVGTIARHGGAVIVGRGAHLILGPGEALRVLVVAPLEARVATVKEREGLSERDARRRVAEVDAERKAFLMKYFHAESDDPGRFDLVVNTAILGVDGAVSVIRAALPALVVKAMPAPSPAAWYSSA